jgi:hypothetical protein
MSAARRSTLDEEPYVSREIIPTLVALRQRFEAIRRAELTRLQPKLSALSLEAGLASTRLRGSSWRSCC